MKKLILVTAAILTIAAVIYLLLQNRKSLKKEALLAEQEVNEFTVRVKKATMGRLTKTYYASGNLKARRELVVLAETPGKIDKINYSVGEKVPTGAILIEVDDKLLKTEEAVLTASLEKAKEDLERFRRLEKKNAVSGDVLEKIELNYKAARAKWETNQQRLKDTRIRAPFSGVINKVFVQENSLIGPGKPTVEIVDVSGFEITVGLTEDEIVNLEKIDSVWVEVLTIENKKFKGKIKHAAVKANMSLQYEVDIALEEVDEPLKSGMVATVYFITKAQEKKVLIPKESLTRDQQVWLVKHGQLAKKPVIAGEQSADFIEIKQGLHGGELIVTSVQSNLREGAKAKILE